jgi:hypothetical protein
MKWAVAAFLCNEMSGFYANLKAQNPEKYANLGKSWKDDEVAQLLGEVQKKLSLDQISEIHKRSVGGIRSRLREIAADYYFNDERPIDEIKRYTGLTVEDISDAISRRQHRIDMAANKKGVHSAPTAAAAAPTAAAAAPTVATGATKTDFYDAIKELLVVAKDIQRMMKDFHADSFVSKD